MDFASICSISRRGVGWMGWGWGGWVGVGWMGGGGFCGWVGKGVGSQGSLFSDSTCKRCRYRKFQNDRMYIRGEWTFRRWHWSKFQWYWPGMPRVISSGFLPSTRAIFKGAPLFFLLKAHAPRYRHRNFRSDRIYICGEWTFGRWTTCFKSTCLEVNVDQCAESLDAYSWRIDL